jgi:hypothetical protein
MPITVPMTDHRATTPTRRRAMRVLNTRRPPQAVLDGWSRRPCRVNRSSAPLARGRRRPCWPGKSPGLLVFTSSVVAWRKVTSFGGRAVAEVRRWMIKVTAMMEVPRIARSG